MALTPARAAEMTPDNSNQNRSRSTEAGRTDATAPARKDGDREMRMRRPDRTSMPKENVTFLGIETGPVSPTLVAQLGLPQEAGLVVLHVVPASAAAGALQPHDILLRLDDQILIDQHQLRTLVRNHQEGDEVTLTYVRAGRQGTARVKLTRHEVPKINEMMRGFMRMHRAPGGRFGAFMHRPDAHADGDRMVSPMQRAPGGTAAPRGD